MELVVEGVRGGVETNKVVSISTEQLEFPVSVVREELLGYYAIVKGFSNADPDEVLSDLSAIGARLVELRALSWRDGGQKASKLRTTEIEPLLDQLEFQFRVASRRQAIREMDFRLSGGAPT